MLILFLEGNFGGHTRTKKMIMKELQDSMNKKLQWIDCRVSVVDSDTYNPEIFQVQSQGLAGYFCGFKDFGRHGVEDTHEQRR